VGGHWSLGKKKMDMPLKTNLKQGGERVVRVHPEGQSSLSIFNPVQFFGRTVTLMEVVIGTGRTHQIRVHAAHAGHAIAGDDKYGDRELNETMKPFGLRRMFLHAQTLSFKRPHTEDIFSISAPLDDELRTVLEALEEKTARKSRQSRNRD
jgi:23S rRNA pseudouridine955/2504/2580 synthase